MSKYNNIVFIITISSTLQRQLIIFLLQYIKQLIAAEKFLKFYYLIKLLYLLVM